MTFPLFTTFVVTETNTCTACGHRMANRKWKGTKQLPGTAGPVNMLGSCLVSFYFLWAILCPQAVLQFRNVVVLYIPAKLNHSQNVAHAYFWQNIFDKDSGRAKCPSFNYILNEWLKLFRFGPMRNGKNSEKEAELKPGAHSASHMRNVYIKLGYDRLKAVLATQTQDMDWLIQKPLTSPVHVGGIFARTVLR